MCTTFCRQYTQFFHKLYTGDTTPENQWEVAISELSYPSMYQNFTKATLFGKKLSMLLELYFLKPGFYHSRTDFVEAKNTHIQERHNHCLCCITVKVSRRTQKVEIYLTIAGCGFAFFSTDQGHIFGSIKAMNMEWCWEEEDLTNENLLSTLSAYTLSWYTRTWLNTKSLVTRKPQNCVVFLLFFKTQCWRHYNYWTAQELSDL